MSQVEPDKILSEKILSENDAVRICADVSDETGVSFARVAEISRALGVCKAKQLELQPEIITRAYLGALTAQVPWFLPHKYLIGFLNEGGLKDSSDLGKVVASLANTELGKPDWEVKLEDYEGIFETDSLGQYLKKEKLPNRIDILSWIINPTMIVGLMLIFGFLLEISSVFWGAVGWFLTMFGFIVHLVRQLMISVLLTVRFKPNSGRVNPKHF